MEKRQSPSRESGFSVLQLVVVIAVLMIVAAFGVMSIGTARGSINLDNSARTLASYLEKARVDSIRRHATTNSQMASVQVLNATIYNVTMDFDGDGIISTRTINVENGVSINIPNNPSSGSPTPAQIIFDWRGRNIGDNNITLSTATSQESINISYAGDVTLNGNIAIPSPSISAQSETAGINPSTIVVPPSSGCSINTNTSALALSASGSGTVQVTLGGAAGINSVTASPNSDVISVTPASQSVTGTGTVSFTVQASKKTGSFAVTFSSPCGASTISVNVS